MRAILASPVGELVLDASESGLLTCGTWIKRADTGDDSKAARTHLHAASEALSEYFKGRRREFGDLSLTTLGTDFQRAVWSELLQLEFATTTTYGEIAARLGRPLSARAVGQANGRNPIGIIQPCHRVVGANGTLVGFGGGLPMKRWLLEHERRVAEFGLEP